LNLESVSKIPTNSKRNFVRMTAGFRYGTLRLFIHPEARIECIYG
jgi:hypothetical protein